MFNWNILLLSTTMLLANAMQNQTEIHREMHEICELFGGKSDGHSGIVKNLCNEISKLQLNLENKAKEFNDAIKTACVDGNYGEETIEGKLCEKEGIFAGHEKRQLYYYPYGYWPTWYSGYHYIG